VGGCRGRGKRREADRETERQRIWMVSHKYTRFYLEEEFFIISLSMNFFSNSLHDFVSAVQEREGIAYI
jgi:hypothetical protein